MTPDDIVVTLRTAGCVFAEQEAAILRESANTSDELATMVAQRVTGRPLEHIVGWVAFADLRILVDDGVFVPRRRTELLAVHAVELTGPASTLIDMCCGAGAVAAIVTDRVPGARVVACDIDPIATRCAQRNIPHAEVYTGDLFSALPGPIRGSVDVVVANAPYVPTSDIEMMPREAREHEPVATLDGGSDGLDIARRIVVEAPIWLRSGGHLVIETSTRQAAALSEAMEQNTFRARILTDEDNGGTVVVGDLP